MVWREEESQIRELATQQKMDQLMLMIQTMFAAQGQPAVGNPVALPPPSRDIPETPEKVSTKRKHNIRTPPARDERYSQTRLTEGGRGFGYGGRHAGRGRGRGRETRSESPLSETMEDYEVQATSVGGGGDSNLQLDDDTPMESPQAEQIDRGNSTQQEQDNVLTQISKSLFGEPETN